MVDEAQKTIQQTDLLRMAVDIVSAYVGNNSVPANQVPDIINTVYGSLNGLNGQPVGVGTVESLKPAVSVRRSVTPEYIICLEDGKKLKMLKRHLMTHYSMTPEQYRAKWGLSADYPMVAPNYAEQRRTLAKSIGLGTKRRKTRGK